MCLSPLSSLPATVQCVSATSEQTEMAGLLLAILLSVLGVLQCVPPRSREQCNLPGAWEDVWTEARDGAQVSPSPLPAVEYTASFLDQYCGQ